MLLDIIVPHYDEPWETGQKLFDMLAMQRGVDFSQFRVLLVNDGAKNMIGYPIINSMRYPFKTVCLAFPHRGVSAARNHGLDYSDAKWVMFCDFDDTFASVYAMRSIMDTLGTDGFDELWSPFYVEMNGDGKRQVRKDRNSIMIHSKIYRRAFLEEHRIRFRNGLNYSEDTAFCAVVDMEIDRRRIGRIRSEVIPYVYAYREGSVTTDPGKLAENSIGLFHRQEYVADEYLKRGKRSYHDALVVRGMCDAYVLLNRKDLSGDFEEFREEAIRYYLKKRPEMETVDIGVANRAWAAAIREMRAENGGLPEENPIPEWLESLSKEKGG